MASDGSHGFRWKQAQRLFDVSLEVVVSVLALALVLVLRALLLLKLVEQTATPLLALPMLLAMLMCVLKVLLLPLAGYTCARFLTTQRPKISRAQVWVTAPCILACRGGNTPCTQECTQKRRGLHGLLNALSSSS